MRDLCSFCITETTPMVENSFGLLDTKPYVLQYRVCHNAIIGNVWRIELSNSWKGLLNDQSC